MVADPNMYSSEQSKFPRMPFSIVRRRSRPANIVHTIPNMSFPAGEASPVSTNGPEPGFVSYPQPRPRSSWYSQASVAYPSPNDLTAPHAQASFSGQALTSTALRSLDEAARQAWIASSAEDGEPESPKGTSSSFTTRREHTAVSEYFENRSWANVPKMPDSPPPPVPASSSLRRSSSSSDLMRKVRPLSYMGPRRESVRRRSSVVTIPYPVQEQEEQEEFMVSFSNKQSTKLRSPPIKFSSPFSHSWSSSEKDSSKPQTRNRDTAATAEGFISVPYEHTRRNASPTRIANTPTHKRVPEKQPTQDAALIRGLSQTYGPRAYPPVSYHNHTRDGSLYTPTSSSTPTIKSVKRVAQQSHHSATVSLFYPLKPEPNFHRTQTRDAYQKSNQGCYLTIGTLRGPTPDGVRMMNKAMVTSFEKKGSYEKGVKEIRKWLKHESRGVIEWTEAYLRRRWGVEL